KDEGFLLAGGHIFATLDGGLSWNERHVFRPEEFGGAQPELYSIRFTSRKKGWVVGSVSRNLKSGEAVIVDSLIYKTADGGDTWERQRPPTRQELIHLDFVNEKHGWIVGSSGTILKTGDGGDTWVLQPTASNATLYHVD